MAWLVIGRVVDGETYGSKVNERTEAVVQSAASKADAADDALARAEAKHWPLELLWAGEPMITEAPEDRMMRAMGAPMLPGLGER